MNIPPKASSREDFVDQLFAWFDEHGRTHFEENVTQLDHALQSANLAVAEGASDAQVVAALLHDVGHLILGEDNDADDFLEYDAMHELAGSGWLKQYFGEEVADPVRLHVAAKRWLYTRDHRYRDQLSDASRRSLEVQGGRMEAAVADAFELEPYSREAVALRIWDDKAKVDDLEVPPLSTYRQRVINCMTMT